MVIINSQKYNKLKKISKATALILISTIIFSSCSEKTTEKEEEDLYVHHNGSFIPYNAFRTANGVINSNTRFGVPSSNGNGYTPYTPTSNEMNSIKNGTFNGKVSRPVINGNSSSSSSKSSTKSFGSSSSRSSTGG